MANVTREANNLDQTVINPVY